MTDTTLATVADFLVPTEEAEEQTEQESPTEGESGEVELSDEEFAGLDVEELDTEAEAESETEAPPPPASWSKEDAAAWKALTPEAREVVMRREKDIEKFVSIKGREVAETKRAAQQEALQVTAQQAEVYAAHVKAILSQYAVPAPDPALLYTGDQNDYIAYQRQDAAHRASLAQQEQLLQQAAQAQGQASQARQQAFAEQSAAEAQRLQESLPEFFDPVEGPKIQRTLETIGAELGYTPELMAQASAGDILALKRAADWKEKAAKYDKIVAKRMETVRSAKTMPKVTRPGAGASQQAMQVANEDRTSAAIQQFQRDRSADAAASLLLVRKR
jgi:hypothetical protein